MAAVAKAAAAIGRRVSMRIYPSSDVDPRSRWSSQELQDFANSFNPKLTPCTLRNDHDHTQFGRLGEMQSFRFDRISKWLHGDALIDDPSTADSVTQGKVKACSFCYEYKGDDYKKAIEVSLTTDPDFKEATIISCHNNQSLIRMPWDYKEKGPAPKKILNVCKQRTAGAQLVSHNMASSTTLLLSGGSQTQAGSVSSTSNSLTSFSTSGGHQQAAPPTSSGSSTTTPTTNISFISGLQGVYAGNNGDIIVTDSSKMSEVRRLAIQNGVPIERVKLTEASNVDTSILADFECLTDEEKTRALMDMSSNSEQRSLQVLEQTKKLNQERLEFEQNRLQFLSEQNLPDCRAYAAIMARGRDDITPEKLETAAKNMAMEIAKGTSEGALIKSAAATAIKQQQDFEQERNALLMQSRQSAASQAGLSFDGSGNLEAFPIEQTYGATMAAHSAGNRQPTNRFSRYRSNFSRSFTDAATHPYAGGSDLTRKPGTQLAAHSTASAASDPYATESGFSVFKPLVGYSGNAGGASVSEKDAIQVRHSSGLQLVDRIHADTTMTDEEKRKNVAVLNFQAMSGGRGVGLTRPGWSKHNLAAVSPDLWNLLAEQTYTEHEVQDNKGAGIIGYQQARELYETGADMSRYKHDPRLFDLNGNFRLATKVGYTQQCSGYHFASGSELKHRPGSWLAATQPKV